MPNNGSEGRKGHGWVPGMEKARSTNSMSKSPPTLPREKAKPEIKPTRSTGAMDTMYQRSKIQEESLYYEHKKHDGSLPLIGVNTFLPKEGNEDEVTTVELMRSTEEEKGDQIASIENFQAIHGDEGLTQLAQLQETARQRDNCFAQLMETVKHASLGQVSGALYDVGGEYRRNM